MLSIKLYSLLLPVKRLATSCAGGSKHPGWRVAWERAVGLLAIIICATALSVIGGVVVSTLYAQDDETANLEYRVKAAYLYQFGRYVEWPESAFSHSASPFVIGVWDGDAIIPDLEEVARVKKINDHPIKIRRLLLPGEARTCHIVYLSAMVAADKQIEVIRQVTGAGVLLVGDVREFLSWGGTIRFFVEDNKIRLQISRKAAERDGLVISAKLLQVAHVVD